MASSRTGDDEVSKLFRNALESFTESIPPADREAFKEFKDASSMVDSIEAMTRSHPVQDSRVTGAFRKFEKLVAYLEPYFQIVDTFVSAKPEFAALLSSNYVTFLERMGDIFAEITNALPAYERFVVLLQARAAAHGSSYPRLGKALALVYVDILRFCHSAYLIFSNRKRDTKLKLSFIGRLLWRPFDAQFRDLLSRLNQHKEVFELEVSLASTEETMRLMDKYEKEVHDAERKPKQEEREKNNEEAVLESRASTLQKWFRPPTWMESFERAQNMRSGGTGRWILESKAYQDWRKINQSPESTLGPRTLSIQAKPGYGKTVLCSTLIEDLGTYVLNSDSTAGHRSHSVVFYFFDRRRDAANSPSHAFRAILAQLVHLHRRNQQVIDMASVLFARQDTGEFVATDNEVIAVLEVLLDQLKFTYLVFDALDECSDYPELFRRLEKIAARSRTCAILITSRPSVKLPVKLRHDCFQLQPQPTNQDKDMVLYLHPVVLELVEDDLFPETLPVDETVSKIIGRANGMFLWARLLMDYLKLPSLTTRDRVNALDHLNRLEGLDSMYRAILSGLERQFPGNSIKSVCRLFQLVAYGERLLQLDELRCAISVPLDSKQTREDQVPNLERVLGPLSGSLIELSTDGKAQFIHLSTKEFFWEASDSETEAAPAPIILTNRSLANRNIAASCLSYLIHTVQPEPLGGSSLIVPHRILCMRKYPLLSYAAKYWSSHLAKTFAPQRGREENSTIGDASWSKTSQLIDTFLTHERTVMTWIEASWLFESPPEVFYISASTLAPSLPKDSPSNVLESLKKNMSDLRDLAADLKGLDRSWSFILKKQPNEIWEPSVTAFSQSRFWLSSSDACVSRIPSDKVNRKGFIVLQSRLSRDGTEMGIVKLFPTEKWLQGKGNRLKESKGLSDNSRIPETDWKATYELWSLTSNKLLQSFEIVLRDDALSPFVTFEPDDDETKEDHEPDEENDERPIYPPPEGVKRTEEEGERSFSRRLILLNKTENEEERPFYHTPEVEKRTEEEEERSFSRRLKLLKRTQQEQERPFDRKPKPVKKTGPAVSVPLDISDDLRRIITLDWSVAILPVEVQGSVNQARGEGLHYQQLDLQQRQPTVHIRLDKAQISGYEDFYHLKFSQSNEFFVLIRESRTKATKDRKSYGVMWLLEIFYDENFGGHGKAVSPKYTSLVATTFFAVPEIALLSPVRGIAFHPWLPCLAFPQVMDGYPQTYIWQFRAPVVLDGTNGLNPLPIHDPPIVDVVFSDDGKYLYGTESPFEFGSGVVSEENMKSFSKPIIVRAPDHISPLILQSSSSSVGRFEKLQDHLPSAFARMMKFERDKEKGKRPMATTADLPDDQTDITTANAGEGGSSLTAFKSAALELASAPRPVVQRMNALAFAADGEGVAHISQLQQLERAGAIVLSTLGTDGMLRSETLSRLPSEVTRCVDVSLVMGGEGDGGDGSTSSGESDTIQVVLDKARRTGPYTLSDVDDVALPAVIQRSRASIPTFVATVPLGRVFGKVSGEVHHQGLIEADEN